MYIYTIVILVDLRYPKLFAKFSLSKKAECVISLLMDVVFMMQLNSCVKTYGTVQKWSMRLLLDSSRNGNERKYK